ncbi:MAG: thiamine phosphate synthase [Thermomicrobiales bacterium]|nr:thiamine phosphate synthase [Thermomicrobiales bacterium]
MPDDLCRRLRLYLVLDPSMCELDPLAVAEAAVRNGVTALQLRAKTTTDRETLDLAIRLAEISADAGVLFLVNDRLDIAMASGAGGVHLGVDDLPLAKARALAGPDFVIGYSPETDEQALSAGESGASYLGVGPIYGTTSKPDAGPAIGLQRLSSRQRLSGLPTIGIGGITAGNAAAVVRVGACGVAVMSAITRSADPGAATRELASALHEESL